MPRFINRLLPIVCLLLAALPLGACSSTFDPRVRLVGVEMREKTAEGVVLAITLEADNETDQALPLRELTYSVYLDGERVFTGERSAEATIRRFGTQRVILPAAFAPKVPLKGTMRCRVEGDLTYLVPGALAEALFDADVVRPSVAFSVEGEATLE